MDEFIFSWTLTSLAQVVVGSCCAEVVVSEISCSGRWKGGDNAGRRRTPCHTEFEQR